MQWTRRGFLHGGAAAVGSLMLPEGFAFAKKKVQDPQTLRERLWIWGHMEGSYDNAYGLPSNSRLTPLEGAKIMGIPNIIMVRYDGKPSFPFEQYARQYAEVPRLMWSFVGASSKTTPEEREHVFQIARKMPNLEGVFMDDFFHGNALPKNPSLGEDSEPAAACSLTELRDIRKELLLPNRSLDLAVTLYTHQLNPAIKKHLELCDLVSFWSWTALELAKLEENFQKYQQLAPNKRTLLGIYMWDFGQAKPLPPELMKRQCELALKWLHEKKIEGLIFLATNICDMDIEAVRYSKNWIAEHAGEKIP